MNLQELLLTLGITATMASTIITEATPILNKFNEYASKQTQIVELIDDPDGLEVYLNSLHNMNCSS